MSFVIEEEAIERPTHQYRSGSYERYARFRGHPRSVDALLNNLAAGVSLDEFLANFRTVRREQALAVLNFPARR